MTPSPVLPSPSYLRRKNGGGLELPALMVLTDRRQSSRLGLVATVAAAVEGGVRAVVLRGKDLDRGARQELAVALREELAPVGGVLLLAGADVEMARAVGAVGVHLASADPWPGDHPRLIVGRSCHDPAEVQAAAEEGADYATVSPVLATASKPGYGPALGIDGLRALVAATDLPLVALGGVTEASAGECRKAGATGVAVMGAVMTSPDPAATSARLLAVLSDSVGPGRP